MVGDLLGQAYEAMKYNRRRTTLTIFGMAWGIATVVLLLAYGTGFGRAINNIFSSFGVKALGMWGGRTSKQAGGAKAGVRVQLELEDVERIQNSVPLVHYISPELVNEVTAKANGRSFQFTLMGHYPGIAHIRNLEVDDGRFYGADDVLQRAHVVVIGSEAKMRLFSGAPAVGETVRADGIPFVVIGVLKPQMQEGDNDINRMMYIPFTTMGEMKSSRYLDGIWLNYEGGDHEKVEKMVRGTLAVAHHFNAEDKQAVWVFNTMARMKQFDIITTGLQVLLAFIGTVTLGIGGIGLMNIMLVAVSQRTREIGVEKALGARKRHILFQFLAEAMTITFVGGIVGILLAYAISISAGRLTLYSAIASHAEAGDIRLIISSTSLLVSTGILILVGLISGMLPAIRAANLNPIEALRYE